MRANLPQLPVSPAPLRSEAALLCKQQGISTGDGALPALPPEYLVFHTVAGYPMWPAWIVPPQSFGAYAHEPAFASPQTRDKITGGGVAGAVPCAVAAQLAMTVALLLCWSMLDRTVRGAVH